jgi:hypothetical protein
MGGVQPNFTYQGHRYREALEPNMTYVATDSASAPPISLFFSLPNSLHLNGTVNLYRYNSTSGQNELLKTVKAGYSYTDISAVYTPSKDGTSSVYFVNGTGISGVSQPPSGPALFPVSFSESGLTSGTLWGVTVNGNHNGTRGSTVQFSLPNGTYSYTVDSIPGYAASNSSGQFAVSGSPVDEQIAYTSLAPENRTYTIAFSETGLKGQMWSVSLNGYTINSTSSVIVFTEKNGSYQYSVGSPAGFTARPASGSVTVSGLALKEAVIFSSSHSQGGAWWNTPLLSIAGMSISLLDLLVVAAAAAAIASAAVAVRRRDRGS